MTRIPSDETVLRLLDRLDENRAVELESEVLDFKGWEGPKKSLAEAVEMAVCFANAEGGLVERAGIGRHRIFTSTLAFGKRAPLYEADEHMVRLTIFNGSYDEALAAFVAKRQRGGETFNLDDLLLLSHLREHNEIDTVAAARLCQLSETRIRDHLDRLCLRSDPWLERRGKQRGVTYHLSRSAAAEFVGKAVYSRSRAIDRVQRPALIRQYVEDHGSISNSECRELLMLGNSRSARTTVSGLLAGLDFLERYGKTRKTTRYRLRGAESKKHLHNLL